MDVYIGYAKAVLETIKHLQVLIAVVIGGLLSWYFTRKSYKTGNFRTRIEFIGVEPTPDGTDYTTHGRQMDLHEVVALSQLEKRIAAGTKLPSEDGILRLPHGPDQRLMMEVFEDHITGPDPRANMAAIKGRPVNKDRVAFCPTFYHEDGDVAMIRVYIVDPDLLENMRKPAFAANHKATHKRFDYRTGLMVVIANEEKSERQNSGETAAVWHTYVKTSVTDRAVSAVKAA